MVLHRQTAVTVASKDLLSPQRMLSTLARGPLAKSDRQSMFLRIPKSPEQCGKHQHPGGFSMVDFILQTSGQRDLPEQWWPVPLRAPSSRPGQPSPRPPAWADQPTVWDSVTGQGGTPHRALLHKEDPVSTIAGLAPAQPPGLSFLLQMTLSKATGLPARHIPALTSFSSLHGDSFLGLGPRVWGGGWGL